MAVAMTSTASAQSLDDLFSSPADRRVDERAPATIRPEVNEGEAVDQRRPVMSPRSSSDLKLEKVPGSATEPPRSMAMQLRQQRALMQSQARIARMEAARWSGTPVLRPSWNPDPYSALRYPNRNLISVPVYYRMR